MLIFSSQNLAYFAVPKTGSTAIEMTLRGKADIVFAKRRKHMPAQRFHAKVAPFLEAAFDLRPDRIAVMRNPEDQLSSWYRYRTSADLRGSDKSTAGLSFDAFVRDVVSDDPPPHAGVGSQFRFLTSGSGDILVNHLFAYEHQPVLRSFLEERFGEPLEFPVKNVSPTQEVELEPKTRALLRSARSHEFALYDQLMKAGGRLDFSLGEA